ncbi:MAG: sulfur carrier protein ThiS adenylyltransferase ThiF [Bacteroidales bacterium]
MTGFQNIKTVLASKCIGIAGAGGLGSNAAAALVRAGIGRLVVADFDVVEDSNLDRQFYFPDQTGQPKVHALKNNLLRINPTAFVRVFHEKITPDNARSFFSSCHVVVEAFDNAEEKEWFAVWMDKHLPRIPLIMASGISGWGHPEQMRVQRTSNIYVCGHQVEPEKKEIPLLAPRVMQVAMMQADLVLEILLKDIPQTHDHNVKQ